MRHTLTRGFLAWAIYKGTVSEREVDHFIRHVLAPKLPIHSFGILDNASNLRTTMVQESLQDVFRDLYLHCSPYSPELKPVERGFSNIKGWIVKMNA